MAVVGFWQRTWHHRQLLWDFIRRDVMARHKGSVLGMAWMLLMPLLMLAVYALVFGYVLNMRWGIDGTGADFALHLFVGLMMHQWIADMMQRAPRLIWQYPNFVKKVIFPLEILPWSVAGAGILPLLFSILVWMGFSLVLHQHLPLSLVALPLLIIAVLPMVLAIGLFLSALGVYLRDIAHVMPVLAQALFFLSPILYSLEQVPEAWQWVFYLNPVTVPVLLMQQIMTQGDWPDMAMLLLYALAGMITANFAGWWFYRLRAGFADVV